MKTESSLIQIIALCVIIVQVSSEYCYYVEAKKSKDNYLHCEYQQNYKELEGISLIHLKYGTTIPVLKKNLFSPFKELKTLYITAANVESIEPGAFDGFELEMVDLYQNKLKTIQNGTFNSLGKLKYLDLSYNKFESLESHTFAGLRSLQWLSLNSNKIKTINEGTFKHLKDLRALYLHFNDISYFWPETFTNLVYLELLDLSFNSLTRIQLGLFSDQRNLQTLLLNHNRLKNLPDRLLENTTSLTTLDISQNGIQELQENLFQRTKRLEVLKFNSNSVSEFNSTLLRSHAPTLREVYFFHNQWKCGNLKTAIEDFEKNNVYVGTETPVLSHNVYGIGCVND